MAGAPALYCAGLAGFWQDQRDPSVVRQLLGPGFAERRTAVVHGEAQGLVEAERPVGFSASTPRSVASRPASREAAVGDTIIAFATPRRRHGRRNEIFSNHARSTPSLAFSFFQTNVSTEPATWSRSQAMRQRSGRRSAILKNATKSASVASPWSPVVAERLVACIEDGAMPLGLEWS